MDGYGRLIRMRDAPGYLGMDKALFNELVRPSLIEMPIGKQGIAFDKLDLDHWVDQYKKSSGRQSMSKGSMTWDGKQPASKKEVKSGTSTSESTASEFAKALKQVTRRKQSGSY